MSRTWMPWCVAAVSLLAWLQDPEKARPAPPPAGASALPPVTEPYLSPVPRLDLQLRATPRDPIEGIWRLTDRIINHKREGTRNKGWMAIGRQHLFLHLIGEGPDPAIPVLRAGVRIWERANGVVRTKVLAGHFNEFDGDLVLEKAGIVENRRFELLGATLRVYQDEGNYLEFVRAE
jgi:hypothetical protein